MKRNILYFLAVLVCITSSCSKYDNYPTPDGGVWGSVVDEITKMPIQTEQPNGIRIMLLERKYGENATPIYLSVMADGTFRNTKVFSGDYEMRPIEGAFFPSDSQLVSVKAMTEVNFSVIPYLAISASVSAISGSVTAKYKISRSQVAAKISEARLLISSIPTVNTTVFDVIDGVNKVAVRNLTGITDDEILNTEYEDTVSGLKPGNTYYARIAARTATTATERYNYSPVFEIKIP